MKFLRIALPAILMVSLTSCGTLGGMMNSWPVKLLDQTGSAIMGYFAENDSSASGKPQMIESRARQVENRGVYAGQLPGVVSSRQGMAAR